MILPISVIYFYKKKYFTLNNISTIIMILLQGLLNAITQSSFFGIVSYFSLEMIISLSAGQGFAGISMNVIQIFIIIFI